MKITRRRMPAGDLAAADMLVADCVRCGAVAHLLPQHAGAGVDHRCGTGVLGPVWTIIERPRRSAAAARRAAA